MPSSIDDLKELLKFQYRKSPLGIKEFGLPNKLMDMIFGNALGVSTSPVLGNPVNVYRNSYFNNPDVVSHERIHAGQKLLDNAGTESLIRNIFGKDRWSHGNPVYEIPANVFMSPISEIKGPQPGEKLSQGSLEILAYQQARDKERIKKQQDYFNKYIDLMDMLNDDKTSVLEASMPEYLVRERIKSYPKPLQMPRNIK